MSDLLKHWEDFAKRVFPLSKEQLQGVREAFFAGASAMVLESLKVAIENKRMEALAASGNCLSRQAMIEIFQCVALGGGDHGDFLKCFAEAFIRTDGDNFALLEGPGRLLIIKYGLASYGSAQEGVPTK